MVSVAKLRQERPEPEKDFHGNPKLTTKFIKEFLKYKKYPDHPMFVDELKLDIIGFANILCLDDYTEVIRLYMERNKIQTIENIGHMTKLTQL